MPNRLSPRQRRAAKLAQRKRAAAAPAAPPPKGPRGHLAPGTALTPASPQAIRASDLPVADNMHPDAPSPEVVQAGLEELQAQGLDARMDHTRIDGPPTRANVEAGLRPGQELMGFSDAGVPVINEAGIRRKGASPHYQPRNVFLELNKARPGDLADPNDMVKVRRPNGDTATMPRQEFIAMMEKVGWGETPNVLELPYPCTPADPYSQPAADALAVQEAAKYPPGRVQVELHVQHDMRGTGVCVNCGTPQADEPKVVSYVPNGDGSITVGVAQSVDEINDPAVVDFLAQNPALKAQAEADLAAGEPIGFVEGFDGQMQALTGKDENAMAMALTNLQRRYGGHPLSVRWYNDMRITQRQGGEFRNTEPWHAIAEWYAMVAAVATIGSPGYKHMRFDVNSFRSGANSTHGQQAIAWSVASTMAKAVPYLWTNKIMHEADHLPLPPHRIQPGIMPHPAMFWSFEAAIGPMAARVDWMLVQDTGSDLVVWCQVVDDLKRDGQAVVTGSRMPWGSKWPEYFLPQEIAKFEGGSSQGTGKFMQQEDDGVGQSLAGFVLRRLAFINSKYVDSKASPIPRHVRKQTQREVRPHHVPLPELAAHVVELRAVEPKPNKLYQHRDDPMDGPWERTRGKDGHWWVRAHNMVWYRDTPNEKVVYQPAHIKGDRSKPLLKTVVIVDR